MTPEELVPRLRETPTAPVYVVGAGITGCVLAERIVSLFERPVVILEERDTIGGNSRTEIDPETGIEIHVYGSHIFHTTDKGVWDYIRHFTDFNVYWHKVLLRSGGRVYSMPINLKTVNDRFGHSCGDRIIRGAGMAIAGVFGRDRTFRIGGDELIAIPLGLTEAQANAKLFSVDLAVKSFNATPVHPDAALSLSAGIAACRKTDKCFRDVFIRADEAMYKTKGEHHRRGAETVKNES